MKKILPVIMACLFFLSSCFLTSKGGQDNEVRDGSSFQKAIIITEKTESSGVAAEYKWLDINYPGYTSNQQALAFYKKRPYDILYIKTASGVSKEIYFDISNYFGKW